MLSFYFLSEPSMTASYFNRRRNQKILFSQYGLCAALVLLWTITAQGAIYYVATTGNDTNPGTQDSPFLTIQKCVDIVVAGDTCLVGDGTYSDTDGNGIVVYIRNSNANGTVVNPITIRSENPLQARIIMPGINGPNSAFRIARAYYIIEGFDITGGTGVGANASNNAVVFTNGSTGSIVRNNDFHDIGRNICSNSTYAFTGVFASDGASNIVVTKNRFHTIGRRRIGEFGCDLRHSPLEQGDHGIYIKNVDGMTISRNVFYDVNRGFAISLGTGTMSNINVYHNTFSGRSLTGAPKGQIIMSGVLSNVYIKNNISHDALIGMVNFYTVVASNVIVSFNLSDTLEKTVPYLGVTFSNNIERSTNLGFADQSRNDFRLASGSVAINRGTKVGVPPVKDGVPDIGAYELSDQDSWPSLTAPVDLAIQ